MLTLTVDLGDRSYPIHIGAGLLAQADLILPHLAQKRVMVVTNTTVAPLYLAQLTATLEAGGVTVAQVVLPDGEAYKSWETLNLIFDALLTDRAERKTTLIALGGGVIGDMTGFAAASYQRGVPFIQIPTTLLSQVDSSVGGKTGINLPAGKNLVGAFYDPRAVLCDLALLDTLPERDVRAGLAEVIKCGFIADRRILELATEDLADCLDVTGERFADIVTRAVNVKAAVVATDFRESTSSGSRVGREALNYGHTLGHAIEAHAHYTWRHGDAISVGMAWMARVSRDLLGLDAATVELHDHLLGGLGLPLRYDGDAYPQLRGIMSLDKKARGNRLRLVGLAAQGAPVIIDGPDEAVLEAGYAELG